MKSMQQGIILMTVLVFLLVLALLSISALTTSQLQIHMSHNLGDEIQEYQAAEAGLIAGKKQLLRSEKPVCLSEALIKEQNKNPWLQQHNICTMNVAHFTVNYFIEQRRSEICRTFYRVTAWATINDNYPTLVQDIIAIPTTDPSCEKNPRAYRT